MAPVTKRLDEISMVVRATAHDVDNWITRYDTWSVFETPVKGAPRRYSQANVEELAMIAALASVGAPARHASIYSMLYIGERGRALMGRDHRWVVFSAGRLSEAVTLPSAEIVIALAGMGHHAISCVHFAAILDEVDELFRSNL